MMCCFSWFHHENGLFADALDSDPTLLRVGWNGLPWVRLVPIFYHYCMLARCDGPQLLLIVYCELFRGAHRLLHKQVRHLETTYFAIAIFCLWTFTPNQQKSYIQHSNIHANIVFAGASKHSHMYIRTHNVLIGHTHTPIYTRIRRSRVFPHSQFEAAGVLPSRSKPLLAQRTVLDPLLALCQKLVVEAVVLFRCGHALGDCLELERHTLKSTHAAHPKPQNRTRMHEHACLCAGTCRLSIQLKRQCQCRGQWHCQRHYQCNSQRSLSKSVSILMRKHDHVDCYAICSKEEYVNVTHIYIYIYTYCSCVRVSASICVCASIQLCMMFVHFVV